MNFALVFSLTDALAFEKVSVRVVQGPNRRIANPADHHVYDLQLATSLRDIALFHKFADSSHRVTSIAPPTTNSCRAAAMASCR